MSQWYDANRYGLARLPRVCKWFEAIWSTGADQWYRYQCSNKIARANKTGYCLWHFREEYYGSS